MRYRRGRGSFGAAGYTITEVLIVLAITTAMFSAVAFTFSGRQGRTEFTQAVRSYEAQLQNTISEVTSGNFLPTQCNGNGTTPVLTSNDPGSCIFIGKFYPNYFNPASTATIRTLVGKRLTGTGNARHEVLDVTQASPIAVPAADQAYTHSFQLQVRRVFRLDGSPAPEQIHGFGFLVPFAGNAAIGADSSAGSRQIALYGLVGGNAPMNLTPMPRGILICLRAQNNQRAEITIGAEGSQSLLVSTLDTLTSKEPCRDY